MSALGLAGVVAAWLSASPVSPAAPPPPVAVSCPAGGIARGFTPPEGFEQWCERVKGPNHVRQGPYRAWHSNGQPFIEADYCSGNRCGRYAEWYPTGRPRSLGEFDVQGRYQGHWTFWTELGAAIEQDFVQGQLVASNNVPVVPNTAAADAGTPVAQGVAPDASVAEHVTVVVNNGPGVGGSAPIQVQAPPVQAPIAEIYGAGPLTQAPPVMRTVTGPAPLVVCPPSAVPGGQPYPQGLVQWCQKLDRYGRWVRHGILREWYPNGGKRSESDYFNGRTTGWVTRWYPNGQKAEETHFRNGVPDGKSSRWSEQGALLVQEEYRLGERVDVVGGIDGPWP